MRNLGRIAGQILFYAFVGWGLAHFSNSPRYVHVDPGMALIKLSFNHASQRKVSCRRRTPEELAKLAPNMRRPLDCPRERVTARVELLLDGRFLFRGSMPPTGLANDGPSIVYERFVVAPGRHRITARLRDSNRPEGFDYEHTAEVLLAPRQNFVIEFRAETGGFKFI